MIEVIIKSSGMMVNKPRISRILLEDEDAVAVRRRDEETNKVEQLTIGQLYDAHERKCTYVKGQVDQDSHLFNDWFSQKYLKGTSLETSVIGIEYRRL